MNQFHFLRGKAEFIIEVIYTSINYQNYGTRTEVQNLSKQGVKLISHSFQVVLVMHILKGTITLVSFGSIP